MANFSAKELQKYTKDELIHYLQEIQFYIPNSEKKDIGRIILLKRHNEISNKLSEVLTEIPKLIKQYNKNHDLEILKEISSLNKKRDTLWDKDRKLSKELYGV